MQPVIIKRERVALAPPTSAKPGAGGHVAHASARAEVRPVVDDGVVVGLEVVCACGEVALVELRYPERAEAQP